jgi:chorismate mutase
MKGDVIFPAARCQPQTQKAFGNPQSQGRRMARSGKLMGPRFSRLCYNSTKEPVMPVRGVRGAITADSNSREEILKATRHLLALMVRRNGIRPEEVGSVIFSMTADLDAEFPALAARQLGWLGVPLMCARELSVPGSLPRCIRVLLHWNTDKAASDIVHVYLKEATTLRPDRAEVPPVDWQELEEWIRANLATGGGS